MGMISESGRCENKRGSREIEEDGTIDGSTDTPSRIVKSGAEIIEAIGRLNKEDEDNEADEDDEDDRDVEEGMPHCTTAVNGNGSKDADVEDEIIDNGSIENFWRMGVRSSVDKVSIDGVGNVSD
jgi:hypothetical protein